MSAPRPVDGADSSPGSGKAVTRSADEETSARGGPAQELPAFARRLRWGAVLMGGVEAAALTVALFDSRNDLGVTLAFHIPVIAMLGAVYALARKGRIRVAAAILALGTWFAVATGLVLFSNLHGVLGQVFMVPVVLSSVTLGRRWPLVLAGVSLTALALAMGADAMGYLPEPMAPATRVNLFSASLITVVTVAALHVVLVGDLEDALRAQVALARAREEARARAERRAAVFSALSRIGQNVVESRDFEQIAAFACRSLESTLSGSVVRVLVRGGGPSPFWRVVGPETAAPVSPDVAEKIAAWAARGVAGGTTEFPKAMATALFGERARGAARVGLLAPVRVGKSHVAYVAGLPPSDPSCIPDIASAAPLVADLLAESYARLEAEGRMNQAQKLEVVGRLAGGVAHDFNNLLTAMRALVDDLRTHTRLGHAEGEVLELLDAAVDRGALVAGQLLAVSKRRRATLGACDAAGVVRSVVPLLARMLPDEHRLEADVPPKPLWARIDVTSLEQITMNLVVNASEAMPRSGTVRVMLKEEGNGTVVLSVSDEGLGMDDEVKGRLFDPFFTTKADGTGLGMAVVRDAVDQYGAVVHVDSEPGRGSTITVRMHRAEPPEEKPSRGGRARVGADAHRRYPDRKVLLVEDNDLVRAGIERMLATMGFVVTSAADVEQARAQLARGLVPDLVVTDLHLPGGGDTLLTDPLVRKTGAAIIVVSGDRMPKDSAGAAAASFVEKPFTREQFAEAVDQALAAAGKT